MAPVKDGVIRRGSTWSYVIRVSNPVTGTSRPKWVGGFATESEAKAARDRARVAARRGEYVDQNRVTVKTYLEEWLAGHAASVKPKTWAGYRDDLRLRIFGSQGALDIGYGGRDANGLRIPRLDVCLGEDIETHNWRHYPLTPVETNYERFIRAIRQGETLEPSFAHAANLQRILDAAMEAEAPRPGDTVRVDA